jgi:hypothetical protein
LLSKLRSYRPSHGVVRSRAAALTATRALAIVLGAVVVPGCGGGDRPVGRSGHSGTLSAAEYRARANAYCRAEGREVRAIPRPSAARDLGSWWAKGNAVELKYAKKFWALKPPRSLKRLHERVVHLERRQVAASATWPKKLSRADDPARTEQEAYRKLRPRYYRMKVVWAVLGLDDCAFTV